MSGPLTNNFEVPSWAGKPPPGLHLDVMKDSKLVQKLMIDEKKCYFIGRNKDLCDFSVDHASCSRVHAALVWHKHLSKPFLIDLGSTHGTHIGRIRLESKQPQVVPMDSELHFGASTRKYVIRERPQQPLPRGFGGGAGDIGAEGDETEGNMLGLPKSEEALDNLTEYNTAHNRRVASINVPDVPKPESRKRRNSMRVRVNFKEDEEVINPEDIDPTIGRFRNLVQTMVIPTKRARMEGNLMMVSESAAAASGSDFSTKDGQIYTEHVHFDQGDELVMADDLTPLPGAYSVASKLGLKLPNLAPDLDVSTAPPQLTTFNVRPRAAAQISPREVGSGDQRRKKYPTEAWPGRRAAAPSASLLV